MQAGRHSEGQLEGIVYKVAWRVMPLMMIGVFLNFVDRANLGFAAGNNATLKEISGGGSGHVIGYDLNTCLEAAQNSGESATPK